MILHLLALDTVCAVIAWALLTSRLVGAEIDPLFLAWTGAGVWLVYTADRWLDSLPGSREKNPGERHYFAGRHRNFMGLIWFIVWILSLGSALVLLPGKLLLAAAATATAAIVYLGIIQTTSSATSSDRSNIGVSIVVGLLVASAATLFPFLNGNVGLPEKLTVWALTVFAFFLQTLYTRYWEKGCHPPKRHLTWIGASGATFAWVLGYPAMTLSISLLLGALLLFDGLGSSEKVSVADWILAGAGAIGFGATYLL